MARGLLWFVEHMLDELQQLRGRDPAGVLFAMQPWLLGYAR